MYLIFDGVNNLDRPQNRGWLKFGTVQGYHHIIAELIVKTAYAVFAVKDFQIYGTRHCDICSCKHQLQYLCRSWWSNGMIPEKLTWVQFPARINTVCSKLLPINNFSIFNKQSYILALIHFLTEYQIRKYVQLCCISFATFFQFFHSFML